MTLNCYNFICYVPANGRVSEWFKEMVLKTIIPREWYRGFESHPFRQLYFCWLLEQYRSITGNLNLPVSSLK